MRTTRAGLRLGAAILLLGAAIAFPLGVIASHQFADVPDSNTFHADIDAIADVGVTTGCGAGNYCPKAYVTREQMAGFLNRLGALSAGKTPVVNATKLDGLDSTAFYTKAQVDALLAGYLTTEAASSTYLTKDEVGSQGRIRWGYIRDLGATVEVYIDDESIFSPTMSVVRTATGVYEVTVPGIAADGGYHGLFVSPQQGQTTVFRACKTFQTVAGGTEPAVTVRVRCYDADAVLADTSFHILLLQ
jgi:hypothetical protein